MDTKKLESILIREEGTKLDFKYRLDLTNDSGKKELTKDICAIANSKGGRGYIVVGVQDKIKTVIGIKKDEEFSEEQVQQIISSRCEPPIPIRVDFLEYMGKKVGIITIFDGGQKPYQVRESGAFYIRRGSTTDFMRKGELISSFEDSLSLTIETCPVIKSNISYLDMELVRKYFSKKGIELNDDNKNFLMESAGIIHKDIGGIHTVCTYGGLLVFSNINSIVIPNNMIKIINKVNLNHREVIVVQGNLISMILKSEECLREIINENYPIDAVLECIKNAILYREYSEVNKIIEVIMTERSISIISPGELIKNNGNGEMVAINKRNMWIYEKLITLDDNKMFLNNGRGFSRIKNSFKNIGRVKFINSKADNSFKVILPGIKNFN
ncbi:MAG: AlbA family DNA-binding domain-containing protein [Clostridium sp.]